MVDRAGKPRLLVVTSTYPRWPGDTEPAFVHQLASRLVGRFEVVVATSRAPGAKSSETMDGVKVCRYAYAPIAWETLIYGGGLIGNLRASPWKLLLLPTYFVCWVWQIVALKRKYRFEVVHAHWFIPGGLVAALAMRGAPICVTAHGTDVLGLKGALWRRLRKFVARRASTLPVVGKRVQDALDAEGITPTILLPMGTDLSGLFVPSDLEIRGGNLLYVGRLIPSKRPEVVLHAFAEVARTDPGLTLDVVGNGPEQRRLETTATELGVRSQVIFHGRKNQAEIADMYRASGAVVIASGGDEAPEGLGLVAIEALGCGCPVISAPNIALQAVLPEAAPIRYARDSSAGALAEALRNTMSARALRMGSSDVAWREELSKRFDWEQVAGRYSHLLGTLAESGEG